MFLCCPLGLSSVAPSHKSYGTCSFEYRLQLKVKIGADADDPTFDTALLSCVQHRNYDMVEFLLQNGANPILRLTGEMISKNNALHMAIMHYDGDVRIIDMILDHIGREGINKTISNRYGKQAMHWLTHICHEVIVAL